MKSTTILSGNFSSGAGKKGNFTGYNSSGQQIFIHKTLMEKIGITTDVQFTQPIFALIDVRVITPQDENGNELAPVERLQAMSVYKTADDLISAKNSDLKLAIMERQDVEATVSSAQLTEASVNAILSASSLF